MPKKGLYNTNVSCIIGKAEWDYVTWDLIEENASGCEVAFVKNPSLTAEELIAKSVEIRRNTYRGKDITKYYTDGSLYTMISNGTFDDIYVGDYFTANNIVWLIADIDNYLYSGDTALTKHHATIIPAKPLLNAKMNSTNTTAGGYKGSEMYAYLTNIILPTYITPAFGDHVIEYRNLVTNSINADANSSSGVGWTGSSNGWEWASRKLDLMSEVNVYGSNVMSSSGYDTGIDNRQYAIFQLKPSFINSYGTEKFPYWLKNVVNWAAFALVDTIGHSNAHYAPNLLGVRPRFLIG